MKCQSIFSGKIMKTIRMKFENLFTEKNKKKYHQYVILICPEGDKG